MVNYAAAKFSLLTKHTLWRFPTQVYLRILSWTERHTCVCLKQLAKSTVLMMKLAIFFSLVGEERIQTWKLFRKIRPPEVRHRPPEAEAALWLCESQWSHRGYLLATEDLQCLWAVVHIRIWLAKRRYIDNSDLLLIRVMQTRKDCKCFIERWGPETIDPVAKSE